ncbi:hypothetical protein [Actinoplanes regularis]|uniref:hypothetical protein n=1 Tax=Actinoplanes regularis TaxID=52697 RepID=UPI0024A12D22|nr:hypothetical protein [Actinoplanes regularis]GLW31776.1 hypothetical protein Areg01_47150 [Actinoplanes regularis]
MPIYGPGHFESRTRIAFGMLGTVLTVSFSLIGLFADLEPVPPPGEVVTGTVYTVVPDALGQPNYVAVRAATSQGPVTCSLGKSAFPEGVQPTVNAQIPIEWTPDHCASGEPSEQLPRWFFFLVAGGAGVFTYAWLRGTASR